MNNEDLVLKMMLDESDFTAGLNSAVKKLNTFDGQVENTSQRGGRSLGNIWTSFVGNFLASGATKIISTGIGMITSSVDGAINRVDTLNNSNRVFENMGFKVGETKTAMKNLEKSISGLPTPLDSAVRGMTALTATYDDIDLGQKVFSGLNNAILGFGGSAAMVDNAIMQLSQLPMDGPLDAQTWNSLRNSGLTPVLNAMAKESGMSMSAMKEAFGSGELTVEDFTQKLLDLNKNGGGGLKSLEKIAKDSTAGIQTGLANMKTAITRGVANIMTSLNEGLQDAGFGSISEILAEKGAKLESMLTKFGKAIPGILKGAKELYDTLEPFAPLFVGLAAGIATFTTVLKIQQTIEGVSKAFKLWKTATEGATIAQKLLNATLLANPIAIIVTAVVALAAGIVYLWKTNEDFRNAVTKIWEDVKQALSDAAESVMKAWDNTKKFFSGLWDGLKDGAEKAVEGVKGAWQGTKDWFSDTWSSIKEGSANLWDGTKKGADGAVQGVKDTWGGVKKWFSDTWTGIKETVSTIVGDLSKLVMDRIGPLVYGIRNAFTHVKLFLTTLWTELGDIAKNSFTILKNIILAPLLFVTSMISGGWEEAKNNMIAVWNNIVEAATNIWGSITTIISSYLTNIKMAAINIWTGLKMSIVNIWTELSQLATDTWEGIKNFFAETWASIKQSAVDSWNNIRQSVVNTWEAMKQGAVDTWEAVKQFFADTWTSIKKTAVDTWDSIKQSTIDTWEGIKEFFTGILDGLVTGAQNAWESLKTGVSDAITKVKETFDDLKNIDLFEIGKNIVQGLIDGIGDMIGAVGEKIKGLATTVKDGIKGALDIHSPSRWMRDVIGKNIPLGVIAGIEEKQSDLDSAVRKMTDLPVELPKVSAKSTTDSQESNISKSQTISDDSPQKSGDVFNITLQAVGDLPEAQMMQLAKKFVKYIKDVKDQDDDAKGGAFGGI